MKENTQFNLEDYQRLYVMRAAGKGIREIGRELKRSPSAVSDALKRNEPPWHLKLLGPYERARYAWDETLKRRRQGRRKWRLKCAVIRIYVEEKLIAGWSPEIISGRLPIDRPGYSISHEAIYQWVEYDEPRLKQYLLRAGKPRRGKPRARSYPKRQPAAPKRSIDIRPEVANQRERFGDFESDLIVGGKSDQCLLTVVDRRLRKTWVRKLPNRQAETVHDKLIEVLGKIPPNLRFTLTQDNGSEHALHADLERVLNIEVYFCHPYSSPERGTVENRNGLIRRFFPKGTDFSKITDEQIANVENWINTRPMKLLKFRTPNELFEEECFKLAA